MQDIIAKFKVLITEGNVYTSSQTHSEEYYFEPKDTQKLQRWMSSSVNIVSLVTSPSSHFFTECNKIISDENIGSTIPIHVIQRLLGLIEGLHEDLESGLLNKLEFMFTASTFDEFLDHAEKFHKSGKKTESSVLASVVFEDTIRKIAKKNNINEKGITLEPIIDALSSADVFTSVKARKVKSHGALRNKALHSQWDDFDLRDVGGLISGTRELIEYHLDS